MKIDRIAILGYGNIGKTIHNLLVNMISTNGVTYSIFDQRKIEFNGDGSHHDIYSFSLDVIGNANNLGEMEKIILNNDLVINCLPYIFNTAIISLCSKHNKHYLGLTEDYLSLPVWDSDGLFLPQCGIAPGIVSIIAQNLMDRFELVKNVKMRVGALPRFTNSKLKYAWTWNSHGLVNEYYKPAKILRQGKVKQVESLTEIENVYIDGQKLEAFHTSGGIGTIADSNQNNYSDMNIDYKTLRYPGHYDYISFMKNELKMSSEEMQKHLLNILPVTEQDVVILYVYVDGFQNDKFTQDVYIKKFYPMYIGIELHTAISYTTAFGLVGMVELILSRKWDDKSGHIKQEEVSLSDFRSTKCGRYFNMTPPEEFNRF